jgi:DNA-binding transcriptional LysR family regulator
MRRDTLGDLAVFLTVAEARSFTRAARNLATSQSAVSQIVRRLEAGLGLKLLTRNTRRVAPTEAGERLIETLRPAFDGIDARIAELSALRQRPSGTLRITAGRHAADTVLWPKLSRLLAEYPEVSVELSIDSALTDIVADRFDAGVRLGEQVAKDMIAVRIGPDLRLAVVGAPDYFKKHGRPKSPHELTGHRCINIPLATKGGFYVWEFEKEGRAVNVRVEGSLVLNDSLFVLKAAEAGHGLACVMEDLARGQLANGNLVRVLQDWCPPFAGYHLYYPDRRQLPPAFTLLVEALRHKGRVS